MVLLGGLSTGCFLVRAPKIPLDRIEYGMDGTPASTLLVFLPGRGGAPEDFASRGFVEASIARDRSIDMVAVDAHFGYYRDRSVVERLWADVVLPATEAGYEEIWLVGTSMGGLGAVAFAQEHTEALRGIVLLAPYLGPAELLDEIEDSGGLAQWKLGETGGLEDLWGWLKGYPEGRDRPELILAFGESDRLHQAHALLAAALPPGNVLRSDGGHGWREWTPLWERILAQHFGKDAARL